MYFLTMPLQFEIMERNELVYSILVHFRLYKILMSLFPCEILIQTGKKDIKILV